MPTPREIASLAMTESIPGDISTVELVIPDGAVTTSKIADGAVTAVKLAAEVFNGGMQASTYDINGNGVVDQAEKLQTPRTITLSGDVVGAAVFDGTTNVTIITTSTVEPPPSGGGGGPTTIDQVTGLRAELDGKAPTSHAHALTDITGIQAQLDAKSNVGHTHSISNVTGLQVALDGKASLATATTTANGLMSAADKTKLNGIDAGANNYVHPTTHPATIIVEDSSHRFVTDSQIATWNAGGGGGGGAAIITATSLPTPDSTYRGKLYLITGADAVAEVATLTITAACTTNGSVTINLDDKASSEDAEIALNTTTHNTASAVATAIRSTSFPGFVTGGTGTTVTFTAVSEGARTNATYAAGSTGASGTMTTSTNGVDGTADALYICLKLANDIYDWAQIG